MQELAHAIGLAEYFVHCKVCSCTLQESKGQFGLVARSKSQCPSVQTTAAPVKEASAAALASVVQGQPVGADAPAEKLHKVIAASN